MCSLNDAVVLLPFLDQISEIFNRTIEPLTSAGIKNGYQIEVNRILCDLRRVFALKQSSVAVSWGNVSNSNMKMCNAKRI